MTGSHVESLEGSQCRAVQAEGGRLTVTFGDDQILFVNAPWRIDDLEGPVIGSLDDPDDVAELVEGLLEASVVRAEAPPPGPDLRLHFSNEHQLIVFADRFDGQPWTISRVSSPH